MNNTTRKHLVPSAGYWFDQARAAQKAGGQLAHALICMEQAYNHVENALAAARDILQEVADLDTGEQDCIASDARKFLAGLSATTPAPLPPKADDPNHIAGAGF